MFSINKEKIINNLNQTIKKLDVQVQDMEKIMAINQKNLDSLNKNRKIFVDELNKLNSEDQSSGMNKQQPRMTTQEFVQWKSQHDDLKKNN